MYEDRHGGWWGGDKVQTIMDIHLGAGNEAAILCTSTIGSLVSKHVRLTNVAEEPWVLDPSTDVQAIAFDADGTLKPSLLAYEPQESGDAILRLWHSNGTGMEL